MRTEHPPYWFWRLDRWKLLLALLLALALLLLALRGCAAPQVPAPVLTAPAAGAQLTIGKLGDITGTARPGDRIQFFDGDRLLGEAAADSAGAFRLAMPAVQPGAHMLTARVVDKNGKFLATSLPAAFTALAAPVVVTPLFTAPASGAALTTGALGEVAGTAAPGALIRIFDGDKLLGETTAGADGKWRLALPALAAGAHALTAQAIGADGKVAATSAVLNLTVAAPPTAVPPTPTPVVVAPTITLPAPAPVTGAGFDLEGTAAPGAKVRVYDGDKLLGETTAGPDGKWKFSVPALAAGSHSLIARSYDASGKETGASQPWKLDLPEIAPPTITIPAKSLPATGLPFGLEGTAAPGAKVRVYDGDKLLGETTAGPDGKWKFILPGLAAGSHSLAARSYDASGKETAASQPWKLDLPEIKAPTITLPTSAPTTGASFDLEGTAAPGAKVRVYDGDKLLGETTAGPDGKWKLSVPGLTAGSHSLIARSYDASGKETGASQPWKLDLLAAKSSPYPAPYVVKLAPGETVTVPVRGFCMNYGRPFPSATLQAVELAEGKVRAAVAYSRQKGYSESDPLQVQLAVWYLLDGQRIPGQTYGLANEVIQFAQTAPAPEPADVQSLVAALGKGLVSAAIGDFKSTSPANFQYTGQGALVLKNLSKEALTLLLPYGVRFRDAARQGTQDMAIFP